MGGTESQEEPSVPNKYKDWDDFCVQALQKAKEDSSSHDGRGAIYMREVLMAMISIITALGWHGIEVILVSTGIAAAGAAIAAIAATLINPFLALGAAVGGVALTGAVGIIYYNKDTVKMAKDILETYHDRFDAKHPPTNRTQADFLDQLFRLSSDKLVKDMFGKRILTEDGSLPGKQPICLCGIPMRSALADDCYAPTSRVRCNICRKLIDIDNDVYHCPNEFTEVHPRGYDICINCARKYDDQFSRFHVLIIDTEPKLRDRYHWKKCFEDLNYHSISILDPSNATVENIRSEMEGLAKFTENDTIVICLSGHGGVCGTTGHFRFSTLDKQKIYDKQMMDWLMPPKDKQRKKEEEESKMITVDLSYKQRDILFLVNSCHSGAFDKEEDEKIDVSEIVDRSSGVAKMEEILNHYRQSFMVISSSAAGQITTGKFHGVPKPGEVIDLERMKASPFVAYAIQALKEDRFRITAKDIFRHVHKKCTKSGLFQIFMHVVDQDPEIAVESGFFADKFCVKPAIKPFDYQP